MARRSIPADAFFKRSPKISVPQGDARSPTFREAFMWTELNGHLGVPVDCFLRTKSDEERDAHLARLKGILKMYAFLTKLEREGVEYRVYYNNRPVKGWRLRWTRGHPCAMLSSYEKDWMMHQKPRFLESYIKENGLAKGTHISNLPGIFYHYAHTYCLYCNGDYDDTIEQELEVSTGRATTRASTWTGERDARLDEPEQD